MGDFGDSDDSDGEGGQGNVNRLIMRPPGHSGKAKRGHLCFDAAFETGNLGRVDLINEFEYDLFIRPDTCSPKYRLWFNFTVDNVKQDQKVIFNIVNISKSRVLFNTNMTPLIKSTSRPKWQRIPKHHVYYNRSTIHQGQYILSFAFAFDKEDDIYQFAITYPYSYTKLQMFLTQMELRLSNSETDFKRELIANSIQNRRIDLITIGSFEKIQHERRRVVGVLARLHPGESPSSYVCQGFLEFMVSSYADACRLRKNILFKVIPMVNPDGVFLGNYRSTLIGSDLNRSFHVATPWAHPTIRAVIDLFVSIDKSKDFHLDFILDIHANPTLTGCFIYGNTYDDFYRYERHIVFPKILATTSDDYDGKNTMFNADVNKIGTARRHLCSTLSPKVNSYSFEVSMYGYKLKDSNLIIPYTEKSYTRCGRNLARALLEYYQVTGVIPIELNMEIKQKRKLKRRTHSMSPNSYRSRPMTSRTVAPLHFKELNIYDSETSIDEQPPLSSYRNTLKQSINKFNEKIKLKRSPSNIIYQSPPETPLAKTPQPSLSIIDFNLMTRNEIMRAVNKTDK